MGRSFVYESLLAAQDGAQNERPEVTFPQTGDKFLLPAEEPFALLRAFVIDEADAFNDAAEALLGEKGVRKLARKGVTDRGFAEFLMWCHTTVYGTSDSPEASSASSHSSESTSTRSKPTSSPSTESTSPEPASDLNRSTVDASAP